MEHPAPRLDGADAARLSALVFPLSAQEFMDQKWPDTFHHFTGAASRLTELLDQPELADVAALLNCPIQGEIRADYTRQNKAAEMAITPARALELYRSACTIYMTRLASAPILAWTRSLDQALGLIPGTAQVNAFASLPGPGLSWHWDPQEIFIVQVHGKKRWHVAPNDDIQWPTKSGQAGAEERAEMRYQLTDPNKPVLQPKQWQSIDMEPGSVLFLPRGYWHTTENIDASVHLVLQVKLLSWRDVFAYLLESVPALYGKQWRKPTLSLGPDRLFDSGLAEFKERCAELANFASPQGVRGLAQLFEKSRQ